MPTNTMTASPTSIPSTIPAIAPADSFLPVLTWTPGALPVVTVVDTGGVPYAIIVVTVIGTVLLCLIPDPVVERTAGRETVELVSKVTVILPCIIVDVTVVVLVLLPDLAELAVDEAFRLVVTVLFLLS